MVKNNKQMFKVIYPDKSVEYFYEEYHNMCEEFERLCVIYDYDLFLVEC